MGERRSGYYFGRFQPTLKKHGELVRTLQKLNPNIQITVGVAGYDLPPSRENFLYGEEAQKLMLLTLEDLEISGVKVSIVRISSQRPFVDSIRDFIGANTDPVVFSGSPSTIKACEEIGLEISKLDDDDSTGPRARHVREGLFTGNTGWHSLVTPQVLDFLTSNQFKTRFERLSSGEKRPWTKLATTPAAFSPTR